MKISQDILKSLKLIVSEYPDAIVGGSISFISRGLLHRDPHDIDIFLPDTQKSFMGIFEMADPESNIGSETTTDVDGHPIPRLSMTVEGVNVCIFKVPSYMLEYDLIEWMGIRFKSQTPKYGILAKKVYSERNKKHMDDLNHIFSVLGER